MANLLIGSSNVNRFYKAGDFPGLRQYKMVKSTQMSGFSAYMDNLTVDNESVLISVFENFVADAVGADIVEPEATIDRCIKDFLTSIFVAAARLPGTKFGIVMPMRRPALPWYQERIEPMTKFITDGIKAGISDKIINNVAAIPCISENSQQFEPDNVHLTRASGKVFLEVVLEAAERFFSAPVVDLTEPGEQHHNHDNAHIHDMEERLQRLEHVVRAQADKNVGNDLMFARSREETDAISNKSKEDRLVINGIKSTTPMPTDPRQRIEVLKTIASGIFESLIPGFQGKIVYLTQGRSNGQPIPMIECKMENSDQAFSIRKAFADKKKSKSLGPDLDLLFIANCVSLATRVRVDVMKAIARKVSNKDDLAYVAGFSSRPMMHIRKAGAPSPTTRPLKSFSYIDTVTKFGHLVDLEDLETAYGRAGKSFNGQLQQNFVVLNERDQIQLQSVMGRASGYSTSASGSNPATSNRGGAKGGNRGVKRPGSSLENNIQKK
jgi:hypothetical protein